MGEEYMSIQKFIEIVTLKNIIIYLIIINVIGFWAMLIDKWKAKRGAWRISEKTLFLLTLLGGGFGTISGMYLCRHKTKKLYFTIGFPVILITEIVCVIMWTMRE